MFEELKRRLTEASIFALPRRHGFYTLGTDAGAGQIGVEAAPKARTDKSELPRTAWIISGVLMR